MSEAAAVQYRPQPVYARDANDFYVDPAWCTDLLLDAERFVGMVWDPACGSGNIVKACLARGIQAVGSDIADRGFGGVQDFLDPDYRFVNVDNIITNPPYRLAEAFIRRALDIARFKVAVLVQQQFPFSRRRYALFTQAPVARLYFLSDRPSMPPGDALAAGTVKPSGGKTDYLWMVLDRDHKGPPTAHWLTRQKPARPRYASGWPQDWGIEPPEERG